MSAITIILVHGALLTSNIWMPVQSYLQNNGYNVVTLDVPGRADDGISAKESSLLLAANKVCKVVNLQTGTVLLAAHSQAGAVITQATRQCGARIAGLAYIAAVVPRSGEKAFDMLSSQDGENFDKVTRLDNAAGVYQINYEGPLKAMFMDDANETQVKRAINNMVPEPIRLGDETLQYDQAAFDTIPKFYIQTTMDKIISPDTQQKFILRNKFKKIYTMKTSHSPFISQPKLLGQYLGEIADSIK